MSELEEKDILKQILKYGYYDETKKYVVVLDKDKLKELFNATFIEIE